MSVDWRFVGENADGLPEFVHVEWLGQHQIHFERSVSPDIFLVQKSREDDDFAAEIQRP